MSKEISSAMDDFEAEILENEVVVAHIDEGHVYHFPILTNGTVSLHGSLIEPNPASKRIARRFLFDAHNAARLALELSQAWDKRAPPLIWRRAISGLGRGMAERCLVKCTNSSESTHLRDRQSFDFRPLLRDPNAGRRTVGFPCCRAARPRGDDDRRGTVPGWLGQSRR
jgi:hypothetical protein